MAELSAYNVVNNVNNTNPILHIGRVSQKQSNSNDKQAADYFEETRSPDENKMQNAKSAGNVNNASNSSGALNGGAAKTGLTAIPVDILHKALADADIEATQYTMEIVKSLIKGSLPLTEKNITDMLLNSYMFKDTPLNVLALMMRLEIPMTQENVAQFENLIGPEEKLSDKIEGLITKLNGEIFADSKNISGLLSSLSKILDIISGDSKNANNINNADISDKTAQSAVNQNNNAAGGKPVFNNYELNNILNMLKNLKAPESVLNRIADANRAIITDVNANNAKIPRSAENRQNPAESILDTINKFIQDVNSKVQNMQNLQNAKNINALKLPDGSVIEPAKYAQRVFEKVKTLFESSEFQKLLKSAIEDKLLISPRNLSGGQIEKFYNRLNENLNKLLDLNGSNNSDKSEKSDNLNNLNNLNKINNQNAAFQYKFQSDAKSIKDCLSLMNELNKTMPFLQIPIKFSDKVVNSDLYIFKNKKRKGRSAENGVESLNTLIKLELENLGKIDIYVNIAGKNVRSKFFAEKEQSVNEINKNLPVLDGIIKKMGFNFTSSASSSEKGFDFVNDFINREVPREEVKKYLFRKKI